MNCRFIFPYCSDNAITIKVGECAELVTLTSAKAEFKQFEMPLNLFFKITEPVDETKAAPKIKRTVASYPKNLDEEFERVWIAKGRKGAKAKARGKFKSMLANETESVCNELSNALIADIESQQDQLGFAELHLTTYLNQERWDR